MAGLRDSKTTLHKWLEKRAENWLPHLRAWCPNNEVLMVAYDNYQKNVKGRHMINGESGKFFNGTMRVFIKAIGVDESLDKVTPRKQLAEVTSDDVSGWGAGGLEIFFLSFFILHLHSTFVFRSCPTLSVLHVMRPASRSSSRGY